jgi:hypothetical protein
MRWLTIDPTNRGEAAYRAEKLKAIDAWWREFRLHADRLGELFAGQTEWDMPAWMHRWLGPVDQRLLWEYGPAADGQGHRLVITPEAEHWLRPLVATLLERAPAIPGWEFHGYRLPDDMATAIESVRARTGSDVSQAHVSVELDGSKIQLTFFLADCEGPLDAKARTAAFVATEELLGEERLDQWIGEIGVAPPPKRGLLAALRRSEPQPDPRELRPLDSLQPRVDALVEELVARLPESPCFRFIHDCQWSSYTLEPESRTGLKPVPPEESDDYAGRADLLVAVTGRPDVFEAGHGQGLFHSRCLSRHGETFCYLKIDGAEGLANSRFEDRAAIEDGLNAALVPAQAGCVIGGGTGLRYSYVDLALVNLAAARQIIRDVLLEGGVPHRTWLLFFDASLSREWIGIHDDTPPPPGS